MKYAKFVRSLRRVRLSSNKRLDLTLHLHEDQPNYCSWYWESSLQNAIERHIGKREWADQKGFLNAVAKFHARYRRFCRYMTEQRHGWREVDRIYFADNSQEVVEMSQLTNEMRQRMVIGPSGD